jgi:hypothetical protein
MLRPALMPSPSGLLPMNVFAMNLTSNRVDYRYLKVLIIAKAAVTKVLSKLFAMEDRIGVGFEIDPDPVSERDAIFHIEKELLHCRTSNRFNNRRSSTRADYRKRLAEVSSASRCAVWAAVHFRLPMRTMWFNPMGQVSFRPDRSVDSIAPSSV